VTHTSTNNGSPTTTKPANCAAVQGSSFVPPAGDLLPPSGGLMGSGTLINVSNGLDVGYKADALEAFSTAVLASAPQSLFPTLASASPAVSLVVNAGGIVGTGVAATSAGIPPYMSDFTTSPVATAGRDAVTSVFMASAVMNEYILDDVNAAQTDWVITHPTKRFYYNGTALGTSNQPGATPFTSTLTGSGACETFGFAYFNREEQLALTPSSFSPPVPGNPSVGQLCYEANVVSFRNGSAATSALPAGTSGVLQSKNVTTIGLESNTKFPNGWALINYTGANAIGTGLVTGAGSTRVVMNQTAAPAPAPIAGAFTFNGLPSTGFMVRSFNNGTLSCGTASCQGNYSALFAHSYRKTITP